MPPDMPRPPSLVALPSYLASQAAKNAHRRLLAVLAEHKLNLSHFAVLTASADLGPLSQQEIAHALDIDKSHVAGFVDELVRRDLVGRERLPADRRRYRVTCLRRGRELLDELAPAVIESQRSFYTALDSHERSTLERLLARVVMAEEHGPGSASDCI